jgi:hypothetical protein
VCRWEKKGEETGKRTGGILKKFVVNIPYLPPHYSEEVEK